MQPLYRYHVLRPFALARIDKPRQDRRSPKEPAEAMMNVRRLIDVADIRLLIRRGVANKPYEPTATDHEANGERDQWRADAESSADNHRCHCTENDREHHATGDCDRSHGTTAIGSIASVIAESYVTTAVIVFVSGRVIVTWL